MENLTGRRYLKTISNYKKIHDHPSNDSVSKSLYTFCKRRRFSAKVEEWKKNISFYNPSDSNKTKKKSCSLGRSARLDFTKINNNVPAPNTYNPLQETIFFRVKKKMGIKIGMSRDKCMITGTLPISKQKLLPGPGTYNLNRNLGNKIGISLKSRIFQSNKENENIGPGKYEILSTFGLKKSALILSKYKSRGFVKINPLSENKKKEDVNPVIYDFKDKINEKGVYYNSKFKNTQGGKFDKSKKNSLKFKSKVPGPGSYIINSDFGIYMSSSITNTN